MTREKYKAIRDVIVSLDSLKTALMAEAASEESGRLRIPPRLGALYANLEAFETLEGYTPEEIFGEQIKNIKIPAIQIKETA